MAPRNEVIYPQNPWYRWPRSWSAGLKFPERRKIVKVLPLKKEINVAPVASMMVGQRYDSIYAIGEEPTGSAGPLKIGRSIDAEGRVSQLQTGNLRRLSIRAVRWIDQGSSGQDLEEAVHRKIEKCGHKRLSGEWFAVNIDQFLEILEKCAKIHDLKLLTSAEMQARRQHHGQKT